MPHGGGVRLDESIVTEAHAARDEPMQRNRAWLRLLERATRGGAELGEEAGIVEALISRERDKEIAGGAALAEGGRWNAQGGTHSLAQRLDAAPGEKVARGDRRLEWPAIDDAIVGAEIAQPSVGPGRASVQEGAGVERSIERRLGDCADEVTNGGPGPCQRMVDETGSHRVEVDVAGDSCRT